MKQKKKTNQGIAPGSKQMLSILTREAERLAYILKIETRYKFEFDQAQIEFAKNKLILEWETEGEIPGRRMTGQLMVQMTNLEAMEVSPAWTYREWFGDRKMGPEIVKEEQSEASARLQ